MSTASKLRKRVGVGRSKIFENQLGKRTVLQIYESTPFVQHIYLDQLNEYLYRAAERIQACTRASYRLLLPDIRYEWDIAPTDSKPEYLINQNKFSEQTGKLRVIISPDNITVDINNLNDLISLAILLYGQSTDILLTDMPHVRGIFDKQNMIKYTRFVFVDMMMANSDPISHIVSSYIADRGYMAFFHEKVMFLHDKGIKRSCFGDFGNDAEYVSFASVEAISQGDEIDWEEYVRLWDEFLLSRCLKYTPHIGKVIDFVSSLNGHSDQISRRRLKNMIEAADTMVGVAILPLRRPSKESHFSEVVSKFAFSNCCRKNWHREISVIPWHRFSMLRTKMIDHGFIEPVKFYVNLNQR